MRALDIRGRGAGRIDMPPGSGVGGNKKHNICCSRQK